MAQVCTDQQTAVRIPAQNPVSAEVHTKSVLKVYIVYVNPGHNLMFSYLNETVEHDHQLTSGYWPHASNCGGDTKLCMMSFQAPNGTLHWSVSSYIVFPHSETAPQFVLHPFHVHRDASRILQP
jgi:hypothetical protein